MIIMKYQRTAGDQRAAREATAFINSQAHQNGQRKVYRKISDRRHLGCDWEFMNAVAGVPVD